jgi:hypothetical protein
MGYTHTHAWKVVNDLRSLANNQKGLLRLKYPAKKSGDMTKMQMCNGSGVKHTLLLVGDPRVT